MQYEHLTPAERKRLAELEARIAARRQRERETWDQHGDTGGRYFFAGRRGTRSQPIYQGQGTAPAMGVAR